MELESKGLSKGLSEELRQDKMRGKTQQKGHADGLETSPKGSQKPLTWWAAQGSLPPQRVVCSGTGWNHSVEDKGEEGKAQEMKTLTEMTVTSREGQ